MNFDLDKMHAPSCGKCGRRFRGGDPGSIVFSSVRSDWARRRVCGRCVKRLLDSSRSEHRDPRSLVVPAEVVP